MKVSEFWEFKGEEGWYWSQRAGKGTEWPSLIRILKVNVMSQWWSFNNYKVIPVQLVIRCYYDNNSRFIDTICLQALLDCYKALKYDEALFKLL